MLGLALRATAWACRRRALLRLAPPFSFLYVAIQQSGSSYPLSLLKRASSGVGRMLSASFMTSSMVRLAHCKIFVSAQLIGWSFAHACSAMADLSVSFDVTSLFTNVPIEEAVRVIRDKPREDEDLVERTPLSPDRVAELLSLCLKSIYFSFGGEFYEQRQGAAMGSPVSAVVANLYMEFFEELALESAPSRPRLWKRYVDDTCCILRKGDVDGLLNHLNSIRPTIKFTMELEEEGSLPFLDTRITRLANGNLDITVYRKKTHTDRYLHFESHHPIHVKKGTVRCLYDRARNLTQRDESLKEEESHLMKTFIGNGYPRAFVQSASKQQTPREPDDDDDSETERPPMAYIPYVAGVSERIRKVCQDFSIRTVFKSGPTLRSLLTNIKDPLPTTKQSNVVYEVPCTCGKVYIGETKRRLETRLKEHKDACTRYLTDKSAIAEHAWANDHPINWAETKILQRANRTMELVMKEALSIRTTPEDACFNRDNGYELPDCWIATYKKLKGGASLSSARRQHAHAVARDARPSMRTD